ncbi:MAG: hypothetical protein ACMG6H_04810 [Acidobacteriota bacterium]
MVGADSFFVWMSISSIHKWDGKTAVKALLVGAVMETVAIAPAVFSPWGHAGPESLWGWFGLLLNVPGLFVVKLLRMVIQSKGSVSVATAIAEVFVIQTLSFSYIAFVWLRGKQQRSQG